MVYIQLQSQWIQYIIVAVLVIWVTCNAKIRLWKPQAMEIVSTDITHKKFEALVVVKPK